MTNEELAIKIQAGETDLIETLWFRVDRLIYLFARKFYRRNYERCVEIGVELDDLYQQGFFGLLSAVQDYDGCLKDYKLTTYLHYHCLNYFNDITKMRSTGWQKKKEPLSLYVMNYENESGKSFSFLDSLVDPTAEIEFENVIDRDYNEHLRADLQEAMNRCLSKTQQNIIERTYFNNEKIEQPEVPNQNYYRNQRQSALERLSKDSQLQKYRTELLYYYGKSFGSKRFKELQMSPQEYAIVKLEGLGLL